MMQQLTSGNQKQVIFSCNMNGEWVKEHDVSKWVVNLLYEFYAN